MLRQRISKDGFTVLDVERLEAAFMQSLRTLYCGLTSDTAEYKAALVNVSVDDDRYTAGVISFMPPMGNGLALLKVSLPHTNECVFIVAEREAKNVWGFDKARLLRLTDDETALFECYPASKQFELLGY